MKNFLITLLATAVTFLGCITLAYIDKFGVQIYQLIGSALMIFLGFKLMNFLESKFDDNQKS